MFRFFDDYSEGVHPELLEAIASHNSGQTAGYGEDELVRAAGDRVREVFAVDGDVHFTSGATQANLVTLSAMMRPWEGVIAPATGHIAVHETGAIEATGHKIITVDAPDGRLTPALLDVAMTTHEDEHTVRPRVVFLTQATEAGTVYTPDAGSSRPPRQGTGSPRLRRRRPPGHGAGLRGRRDAAGETWRPRGSMRSRSVGRRRAGCSARPSSF